MKTIARAVPLVALLLAALVHGRAQERPPASPSDDPRVGLKPGFRDAGQAARSLELVATVPKPAGFFDPKAPAGEPTPPEDPKADEKSDEEDQPADKPEQKPDGSLNFANSDLAFRDKHMFAGNFSGFNVYDISSAKPALIASVVCPGGQGDVSVHGNLLIMSVEQTRGRLDCGTQGNDKPISAERFRGIRVFDITDLKNPKQVAAVQTCRGSHTHTLLVDPKDKANLYVYGSGTGTVRSAEELAGCSGLDPKKDANTALFSIDVIQIPVAAPDKARIVSRPRIFADAKSGAVAGLWPGGDHGPGTQKSSLTNQCHDITVFPQIGLAAGACAGNGILLDITDPVNPVRLDQVIDKNFAYWHSATFNNAGTKVVFTDEWGGGTRPRCRPTDPPTWGANAIFDVVDRKLKFASYYKIPAPQSELENCVAHNGSIIPVPGRDIMVQAWYQGGVSVFDFTDSSKPFEIGYFDRGPVDGKHLITGGHWSAYWYNGLVYGAEIARGIDVLRLQPGEHLTQHEIDAAAQVRMPSFNAQQQLRIEWPASPAVARAYLDQLARAGALPQERIREVREALDRADRLRPGADSKEAAEAAERLTTLASRLEGEAQSAAANQAHRLRALAAALTGAGAKLR